MADTDSALQHPPPINTVDMPLEPLPEGIYGFVMASLIKDSADMKVHGALRPLRIFSAFTLFSLMFILQMFLIIQTKRLVTPGQVANAREVYGMFEATMYTDDSGVQHTWNTSFGYPRGHDGFFNEKNFAKLGREEQRTVCRIPLSQPWFLFSVLFIWALTCLHHVRRSVNLALRFVAIPTIDRHDITVSELRSMADGSGDEVVGLPCWLKVALIVFVQSPRVLMSFFLMCLGARWLTATLGFGEVLLNGLALEFILNLSEILYNATVPYHSQLLVRRLFIPHVSKVEPENCRTMFGMIVVAVVAAIMVLLYMTIFQQVLPSYRWDVNEVCRSFLDRELAV